MCRPETSASPLSQEIADPVSGGGGVVVSGWRGGVSGKGMN